MSQQGQSFCLGNDGSKVGFREAFFKSVFLLDIVQKGGGGSVPIQKLPHGVSKTGWGKGGLGHLWPCPKARWFFLERFPSGEWPVFAAAGHLGGKFRVEEPIQLKLLTVERLYWGRLLIPTTLSLSLKQSFMAWLRQSLSGRVFQKWPGSHSSLKVFFLC